MPRKSHHIGACAVMLARALLSGLSAAANDFNDRADAYLAEKAA